MLKTSLAQLRTRLPGPQTARWPAGERFAEAFAHGSMSVELYVPDGSDPQQAHERDEVYFVVSGSGEFVLDDERVFFAAGKAGSGWSWQTEGRVSVAATDKSAARRQPALRG